MHHRGLRAQPDTATPFDPALLDRRIEWEDRRADSRETALAVSDSPPGLSDAERDFFRRADRVESLLGGLSGVADHPPELPGFVLISRLGGGGMGEVWLGTDLALDRPVAVKFPHRKLTGGAFAGRFAREGRALARLDHPNIVRVHEAGAVGDQPFLVMEYIAGGTLEDRLDKGPVDALLAAEWIAGAARAAHHAHDSHVVHRDLKPSNLLLTDAGIVKVVDFGVAALLADWDDELRSTPSDETPLALPRLTRTDAVIGTPPYAAPEAYRSTTARPESDIWSLGVILYLATTGQLPFEGKADAVRAAVLSSDPVPPSVHAPAIPHWLEAVILRCLAKEPAARFPSAAALAEALEAGVAHQRLAAGRRGRRARFAVGAAAAALVASLAVAAVQPLSDEKRYEYASATALRALESGKTAEMLKPNRRPTALAVVNPTFITVGRDADGNPAFDVIGPAVIEFLPSMPAGDFRIVATLRQTHANNNNASVALFACGTKGGDASLDCVHLRTTDLGQGAAIARPGEQAGALAQVRGLRHSPDVVRASGFWEGFANPSRAAWRKPDSDWRRFELSIVDGVVYAGMDGLVLPPEPVADFRHFRTRSGRPLVLEASGSVGLVAENCNVAIRDFTVTPLPKERHTR